MKFIKIENRKFGRNVATVTVTVTVDVANSFRNVPIDLGEVIIFRKDFPKQLVYSTLPDYDEVNLNDVSTTDLKDPGQMGIVIDSGVCLDKDTPRLELRNGMLSNAILQRWYMVKFPELSGWVREDWIQTFEESEMSR